MIKRIIKKTLESFGFEVFQNNKGYKFYSFKVKDYDNLIKTPTISKVVGVTPAGRKRYLEILVPFLLQNRDTLDRHVFWLNTTNKEDLEYIKEICNLYPTFFSCQESKVEINGNLSISHFFENCVDKDTIYVRFDDDICYIDKKALKSLISFRLSNPNYFLVFGNIINNSVCSFIHQKLGALPNFAPSIQNDCLDEIGWRNSRASEEIHERFLKNLNSDSLGLYNFEKWVISDWSRFSINYFCWFGSDFAEFSGKVGVLPNGNIIEEESWLTEYYPKSLNRPNVICGKSIVSHFAFFTQREHLEKNTNLLERYKKIAYE